MSAFSELEKAFESIHERLNKIEDAIDRLVDQDLPWIEDEIETLRHRASNVESKLDCNEDEWS